MKRIHGFLALTVFAVLFAAGCSAIQSFYTGASPLPSAANMQADCTAHPGSASCDTLQLLTEVCNGSIAIPMSFGNINQAVCVGLGYGPANAKLVAEK